MAYQTKQAKTAPDVQVGDRFPLTIKQIGINGEGIGYYKHKITFVPFALPEELITAEVTEVDDRYLRAKVHKIRRASEFRVEARDSYANEVGGFELEHLAYPRQLKFKRDLVRQALEKFKPRGYQNYVIRPTMGMEHPYGYRNKAQFQLRMVDGHVAAGLFKPGTHEVVDLEECSVQMPMTMTVMRKLVQMVEELGIPVYDEAHNSGIIKTVVVRVSQATGQVQVTFITNTPKLLKKHQLLTRIAEELPQVSSVMQNVNQGTSPLNWGSETIHLAGADSIREQIGNLQFQLSARAFLQLNPLQTPVLYDEARKALKLSKHDTLVDAYSGIGTIGLSLAKRVHQVVGMEVIPEAVADANRNALMNGIDNAHYEVGTAEEIMPEWLSQGLHVDALVVDPPRAGLDPQLIDQILAAEPEKFVYVSCNPSTLGRDLVPLTKKYTVEYMQPIDMMPQTSKCEVVVRLVKK